MSLPPNPPNPPNPPHSPNPPPPPRPAAPNAPNTPHAAGAPPRKSNTKACLIIGAIVLVMLIAGAIAAVSFVGSLVKGGSEKLLEAATGATGVNIVNNDGEKGVSFKDKDGNEFQMTASKEIPADFPKDEVTLYDGTITRTARTKIGDKTMWTIMVTTNDDKKQVAQFIADQFAQNGWQVITEQDTDNRSTRLAKNANYSVSVTYVGNQEGGQTEITYLVHTQEKPK